MKKAIIILVSAALIVFGSVALAQGLGARQKTGGSVNQYSSLVYNTSRVINFSEKVLQKRQAIAQNRAQIKELHDQLSSQIKQARSRIKVLRKNPAAIDAGQVDNIRTTFDEVVSTKKTLDTTNGLLKKRELELKQARLQRKPEVFLKTLDNIIMIQQNRITSMQKMINDLEQLEKALG